MWSPISRARLAAVALIAGAAHPSAAVAADMPFPAPPAPVEEPVEWGTGWYLRGDLGVAYASPRDLNGALLPATFPNNWSVGIGGGYQFNSWFRTDITVDYESFYNKNGRQPTYLPCQIGAAGTPVGGPFTGSLPVYTGCQPLVQNRTESMLVLGNAYLDLGNWSGFTPYIGAGAGVNVLYQKASVGWFTLAGAPYEGTTWTDPFTLATVLAPNWDHVIGGTFLRFSYALMAGVSYDVTDHIKADVGYRYTNLGKIEGVSLNNTRISKDLTAHQVRVGLRYVID